MADLGSRSGYLSLVSERLPENGRVDAFRETYSTFVVPCEIEVPEAEGFWGSLESRRFGDVTVATVAGSAMRCRIEPSVAARGEAGLLIDIMASGQVLFEQGRNSSVLTPGVTHLCVTQMPFHYLHDPGFASRSIVIPERQLGAVTGDIERLAGLTIGPDSPEMRLMASYLESLDLAHGYCCASEATFSRHLVELGLSAISRLLKAEDPTGGSGLKAARLRQLRRLVDEAYGNPVLSAAVAARQIGVTERYVQKLAETAGTTFSAMLMERRLTEAWHRLSVDAEPSATVQDIAWAVGFSDASHFTRAFRRRFGDTPSVVRGSSRLRSAG